MSPPLTGSASDLVPLASGDRGSRHRSSVFGRRAVRDRPVAADFGLSPFGYGLRLALSTVRGSRSCTGNHRSTHDRGTSRPPAGSIHTCRR